MRPSMRCLLALLLASAVLQSTAQPLEHVSDGFRLTRLLYENTLGERGSTEFLYDADGRAVSAVWELADHSKRSNNTYAYNHRGLLVAAFREFSDSVTSFEAFTYDDRGNRTGERFCRSDRVRGAAAYHYDAAGRRVRAVFQRFKGWLDGEAVYRYDAGGVLLSAVLLRDEDTVGHIVYRYDANGNLAQEVWDFHEGWKQTFTYEYVPSACRLWTMPNPLITNTCACRVKGEEYSYNDTLGGPSTYEYAPDGRLVRKTFLRSDGLRSETVFTYDPERRLERSVRTGVDGRETIFLYEHDPAGRLVLRTGMTAGAVSSTEWYQYDDRGSLTRAVYQNVDGWLTGVLAFRSDARGRLTGGTFQGDGVVRATIGVVRDGEDRVQEMVWRFAGGTVQRYRFTYEPRGGI